MKPIFLPSRLTWLPCICLSLALPALAASDFEKVNLREQCRRLVSATYLRAFDDLRIAKDYLLTLEEKSRALDKDMVETQKKIDLQNKELAKNEYNSKSAMIVKNMLIRQSLSKTEKSKIENEISSAKTRIADLESREQELRSNIEAVFHVKVLSDKWTKGYPIDIKYKSSCPKYRDVCKLPRNQARKLLTIKVDGETPLSCKRYSTFSTAY